MSRTHRISIDDLEPGDRIIVEAVMSEDDDFAVHDDPAPVEKIDEKPKTPLEIELARLYAYLHQMASIVPAKPYTLQSVGHALAEIRALAGNAQKARWHLLSGDPEVDVDPFWANKACRITLLTKAQVVDAFNALGIQEIPWWDDDPDVPEQCMVVIMPMKHKIEQ